MVFLVWLPACSVHTRDETWGYSPLYCQLAIFYRHFCTKLYLGVQGQRHLLSSTSHHLQVPPKSRSVAVTIWHFDAHDHTKSPYTPPIPSAPCNRPQSGETNLITPQQRILLLSLCSLPNTQELLAQSQSAGVPLRVCCAWYLNAMLSNMVGILFRVLPFQRSSYRQESHLTGPVSSDGSDGRYSRLKLPSHLGGTREAREDEAARQGTCDDPARIMCCRCLLIGEWIVRWRSNGGRDCRGRGPVTVGDRLELLRSFSL